MSQHARRSLALVAVLALLLTSITPALAIGPSSPGFDGSGNGFEPNLRSARLKHPTLDSTLAGLVNDVQAGQQSESAIARKAIVSRGVSVAVSVFVEGDPAETAAWLTARGAQVDGVGIDLIEAYVPVAQLEALGARAGVLAVRSTIPPFTKVVSQGVGLHGSPNWNQNGYSGAGVKVGVIDVGFEGIVSLIGNELPALVARCYPSSGGPTASPADCDRDGVHGSAVAETVMDVAPQASLYVSNPGTWLELRETVTWMASQGVTVINHSVGWVWEGQGDGTSVFGDGPLSTVDHAVANGITWVNAAGNEGASTWSGLFEDANDNGILDFAPGNEYNAVDLYAGGSIMVVMRWEDAWPGAASDLDIALLDVFGNILAASEDEQSGGPGDLAMEILTYTPSYTEVGYLGIVHYAGAEPDWVQIQEFNGATLGLSNPSGSVGNPAESANSGMLAVGAASWMTPGTIEDFSSQGPTRDGRIKPDIVGIDQADTVSYGPSGFPGTSQASPHVAGLATLVKQRFPHFSPTEVAQYLRSNATQAHAPNNVWGYGLAYLPEIVENENPVPTVSSVSPNSVSIGTYPLTVTVNGSGFVQESVARWNGQDRPTTYVSPNQLTFGIQHLDADHPSTIQITVNSPAPGGGVSNAVTLTVTGVVPPPPPPGGAVDHAEFLRTWQRTDEPVKQLAVNRTWMWGDVQTGALLEEYAEASGDQRSVKYYDKSRMEVTDPNGDKNSVWYVTNGLLSKELITGQRQMGDNAFENHGSAQVPVAGDPDDADGPTYATFNMLLGAAPHAGGSTITQRVDRDGNVTHDPTLAQYGVTAASLVEAPGISHQVASPFWDFINTSGLVYENGQFITDQLFESTFYATGLPITEAYWARVKVAGVYIDVLMQCFERRCLTYNPANPDGWKVEAGNVGLHYYLWRYGMMP